jgi:hypothetical protein
MSLKTKILVYSDTKSICIYNDFHRYLICEFELTYYNSSTTDIDFIISILKDNDIFITNLIFINYFIHLPSEILKKMIFACHRLQEIEYLNNANFTLPSEPNYSILNKSMENFFPENIRNKLYHTYHGIELSNFNYIKRNGELNTLGFYGINDDKINERYNIISEKTNLTSYFVPDTCNNEFKNLYKTLDILLIMSEYSQTSTFSLLEAIASGVLIIGSTTGNLVEIPGPKYSTIQEAIDIIIDLKNNPNNIELICDKQYAYLKKKWLNENLAEEWIKMYYKVPHFLKSKIIEFDHSEEANLLEDVNYIPRILHLIWVGDKEEPFYFNNHVSKWKELMPNWEIRVWKNNDITTDHFPLSILDVLNRVEKGAQKADIIRYFIIEKYGGIYVDSDITPHRSLEPFIKQLPETDVILCHDIPISWQYIMNAFFGAIPHHPIFQTACNFCYHLIINTEDIHLQTGPRLLGASIFLNEIPNIMVLKSKYFYHNQNYDGRFGNHFYAKNW